MHARIPFWIALFLVALLTVYGPPLMRQHVWQQTVFAQSIPTTIPLNFTGGGPGCTVFVPSVAGQRVWVSNGLIAIPSFGTGLTISIISTTDNTARGGTCATNVTQNQLGFAFVGSQAGTSAVAETIFNLIGNPPVLITPAGQGISATVTAATGAQAVGGFITFQQF